MQIQIDHEFLTISEEILKEDHSLEEWEAVAGELKSVEARPAEV